MQRFLVSIIEFYQRFLSFDTGALHILTPQGACRYSPTCSEYTKQAILKEGSLKGVWMGFKRVLSCNPWS